jgi:hypothetical protein
MQFDDEERRSRYLRTVPAHRELLVAWHAGEPAADSAEAPPSTDAGRRTRLRLVWGEVG